MLMKAAFNVKSGRLDVLSLQLLTDNLTFINKELQQRTERFGNLRNMPFTLDMHRFNNPDMVDLGKLIALFARYNLRIVAIRHADEAWAHLASEFGIGFGVLPEEQAHSWVKAAGKAITEQNEEPVPNPAKPAEVNSVSPTLIINRTVRTGQQIYAEKGDLIVMGLVSEGAEIIADGNIHVYGPLRGRALAGAAGNKQSRIFAQSMQAELVSVAGIYRIFDQQLPAHLDSQPVQTYLQDDRLILSAIHGH